MTKEEALEKVKAYIGEQVEKGNCITMCGDMGDKYAIRIAGDGGVIWDNDFPYAPPREAPPMGTPVMDSDFKYGRMYYSLGRFNGVELEVSRELHKVGDDPGYGSLKGDIVFLPNWRTVSEQPEMVKTYHCEHNTSCEYCRYVSRGPKQEPCASCKTTVPTNWKGF